MSSPIEENQEREEGEQQQSSPSEPKTGSLFPMALSPINPGNMQPLLAIAAPNPGIMQPLLAIAAPNPGVMQPQLAIAAPAHQGVEYNGVEPSSSSHVTETKTENQNVLEHIFNGLSVKHNEEFKKLVIVLGQVELEALNVRELEDALDQLIDDVGSVHTADLFYHEQGLAVTARLLGHCRASIRWRAATVIAECCMNNPFCRSKSTADDVLGILMGLAYDDPDAEVKFKSLCAVSAIVKGNEEGIQQFRKYNGFAMIREFLKFNSDRFRRKIAFLIVGLCDTDHAMKDDILATGVLSTLISYVKVSDDEMAEHYIRALLSLTQGHKVAIRDCRKNNLDLWGHVAKVLTTKYNDDAAKELVECSRLLVARLSDDSMAELQELYPGEYIYNLDDSPPGVASSDDDSAGTIGHDGDNECALALDIKQLDINKK